MKKNFSMVKSREISLSILFVFLSALQVFGQETRGCILKAGAFIYLNHFEYEGYSLHLEYERSHKKAKFLTLGPRIDYVKIRDFGTIGENIFAGYQLKFYPFFFRSGKDAQGLFAGVEPLLLLNKTDRGTQGQDLGRYGPGMGSLLGYQHIFKQRFSLAIEGSANLIQNLNGNTDRFQGYHHKSGRYFYFFANVKLGIRF